MKDKKCNLQSIETGLIEGQSREIIWDGCHCECQKRDRQGSGDKDSDEIAGPEAVHAWLRAVAATFSPSLTNMEGKNSQLATSLLQPAALKIDSSKPVIAGSAA